MAFLLEPYHRQRRKRLIKAPKLYFNDTGLLCFLLGFRDAADIRSHAMWGSVWENFVIAELRKRAQSMSRPPSFWFWRTATGTLDAGFNPDAGLFGVVRDLEIQPDGMILAAGDFTSIGGVPRNYIARIRL